ncbi:MAG: hypothetical protein AAF497_08200, partial [Planctomycetota bacterium]
MLETLTQMQSYHAAEIFLIAAAILILIDYYFATDWPAHVGYFCIAASVFFYVWNTNPGTIWELAPSLLLAIAVDKILAVLHHLFFFRFLANAPGTERYEMEYGGEA